MISTISRLIISIIASLFLMSCGMTSGDAKDMVAKIKKSNDSKMEELPNLQEYEQIGYDADKLNDPFDIRPGQIVARNPVEMPVVKVQQKKPDYDRPREYLESYSLDSLTMVGTLQKRGEMWALIVDRAGIIHKVKEGNYLGQNSGKITRITENNIDINEIISDEQGGWVTRNANVSLKH